MTDMTRQKFFESMAKQHSMGDLALIAEAYQLSKALHRPQSRKSGERYFEHPRAVALILNEEFGPASCNEVVMALLHDSIEDCYIVAGTLQKIFGFAVATGVDRLSKCTNKLMADGAIVKTKRSSEEYWNGLKRADRMARRVKLADRLHNLRTMKDMGRGHWGKQIDETRLYVLPLAAFTDIRFYEPLHRLCCEFEAALL